MDLMAFPKGKISKVSHDPCPGCGRLRLWSVLRHVVGCLQHLFQHFDAGRDLRTGEVP